MRKKPYTAVHLNRTGRREHVPPPNKSGSGEPSAASIPYRLTPAQSTRCRDGPAERAAAREDQIQKSITALQACVSTVSIVCKRCCSFRNPSKTRLITVRAIPAGGPDDADGADGSFRICAHSDYSVPGPAFTRERDLDAQHSQERLGPAQSAGERARVFCPWRATREVVSISLRTQTQ
jgi:hypothetical protein